MTTEVTAEGKEGPIHMFLDTTVITITIRIVRTETVTSTVVLVLAVDRIIVDTVTEERTQIPDDEVRVRRETRAAKIPITTYTVDNNEFSLF